ncbi:transposase [Mesorhizobium sp. M1A.F.Ca.ET.072.01.1.1]|nr:transposase [Mesorhizobium sp. M1A.F.Ca.ET.072.01.1.1]
MLPAVPGAVSSLAAVGAAASSPPRPSASCSAHIIPKQHSSGGKDRMGGISKMGDRYLRHLIVVGATAVIRYTRRKATTVSTWANQLLERKPARLVTVAVANKVAPIAWVQIPTIYRTAFRSKAFRDRNGGRDPQEQAGDR